MITEPPPPPAPPRGYTLVAYTLTGVGISTVFGGTPSGRMAAVQGCIEAETGTEAGTARVTAVAWWIDESLDYCANGRERLVSVYDAATRQWGEWVAEGRIGEVRVATVRGTHLPTASLVKGRRIVG